MLLRRMMSATRLLIARATNSIIESVDNILETIEDTHERDAALRKLLSKYAPCPVEGYDWSLINTIDYNFDGFDSAHLTQHAAAHNFDVAADTHVPHTQSCLYVVRDLGLAAKLAYEDPNVVGYVCKKWHMETNPSLYFTFKDTQAYIMYDDSNIVLSFRGTELLNPKDWSTDFKVELVPMRAHSADGAGESPEPDESSRKLQPMVHKGFMMALGLSESNEAYSAYSMICAALNKLKHDNPQRHIWVTGHSLGAALASVFVAQLILDDDQLLSHFGGIFTYGQPRSGNKEFCKLFEEMKEKGMVFRVVNKSDLVTKVPMKILEYMHHGEKLQISSSKIKMRYRGEKLTLTPKSTKATLPKSSGLKKAVFVLIPGAMEDHYPCEYIRNVQLYI
jgi:hypothetical protein